MVMSERVQRLREESAAAPVEISTERAELLTRFYRENIGKFSTPVTRAKAFEFLCRNQTIYLGDGELVVGERRHGALDDLLVVSHPVRNPPSVSIANPAGVSVALSLKSVLGSNETALEPGWLGCKKAIEATHS